MHGVVVCWRRRAARQAAYACRSGRREVLGSITSQNAPGSNASWALHACAKRRRHMGASCACAITWQPPTCTQKPVRQLYHQYQHLLGYLARVPSTYMVGKCYKVGRLARPNARSSQMVHGNELNLHASLNTIQSLRLCTSLYTCLSCTNNTTKHIRYTNTYNSQACCGHYPHVHTPSVPYA